MIGSVHTAADRVSGSAPIEEERDALVVEDLSIELRTEHGWVSVVNDVGLRVEPGTTLGMVGESGSGKTVTSLAVMGLLHLTGGRVTAGRVALDGEDLTRLTQRQWANVRGRRIGMIFQQPQRSIDPAFTVGDQIAEAIRAHTDASRKKAWARAIELLDRVGIPNAHRRVSDYPYSFSGGMCQRVMIAIALAPGPRYLIADEPTTALDVTVQAQVLELLRELQQDAGLGILFITHDVSVIAEMSDRVAVMYAGQVVEEGATIDVLGAPTHPYTEALLRAVPAASLRTHRFESIPGQVPSLTAMPSGCRFAPRCRYAIDACTNDPPKLQPSRSGSSARCIRIEELELRGVQ